MRGVTFVPAFANLDSEISIHTPHAGSDSTPSHAFDQSPEFQSTLPMRGVTEEFCYSHEIYGISIHTPHAGSDNGQEVEGVDVENFNPHSPCGE